MTTVRLLPVTTEQECLRCFDVMRELRPHLDVPQTFVSQIMRQMAMGYRLLAAWEANRVVGLAGYRLTENLLYGRSSMSTISSSAQKADATVWGRG